MHLCAVRNGQVINKNDLARDVGVSVKEIGAWLSVLQASNQVILLEPYFENVGQRIIKSPKLYFADVGFLAYLLGVDESNFSTTPFLGMLWEAFIFAELRKYSGFLSASKNIFFYRDKNGTEVDFIVVKATDVMLIECKWSELPAKDDCRNIELVKKYFTNHKPYPYTVKNSLVVCRTPNQYLLNGDVKATNGLVLKDELVKFLS